MKSLGGTQSRNFLNFIIASYCAKRERHKHSALNAEKVKRVKRKIKRGLLVNSGSRVPDGKGKGNFPAREGGRAFRGEREGDAPLNRNYRG